MYRMILSLIILTGFMVSPFYATAFDLRDEELLLYFPLMTSKEMRLRIIPHMETMEKSLALRILLRVKSEKL